MSPHLPLIARAVFATSLCVAAVPAFADEEFSVGWLEQREVEMTRDLTSEIERENSDSLARNVVVQLASTHPTPITSSLRAAVGPAAPDFSDTPGAAAERATMQCHADHSGSYACTLRTVP